MFGGCSPSPANQRGKHMKTVYLDLPAGITDYVIEDLKIKVINTNRKEEQEWQDRLKEEEILIDL